jgi:septum formation protein
MRMLTFLSGKTHSVFTGLALYDSALNLCHCGVEESRVTFNHLDEQMWLAISPPAAAGTRPGRTASGMGPLVDSIEGNLDNVIGLPMGELERIVEQFWIQHA